ncbi:hypothetical protein QAD02_000477 [Eretmocerus hayati]|uniref:Uncharacterized protein n=1 Tax=Eretmocerus hayati TaxID=131215 RepID=A0ACC2NDK1_9HYME|nr:hypothetical protein QAD02_000477 [Eretmocerus hayati]
MNQRQRREANLAAILAQELDQIDMNAVQAMLGQQPPDAIPRDAHQLGPHRQLGMRDGPDPLPRPLRPQEEIRMAANVQVQEELPWQGAPVFAAGYQLQPRAQLGIRGVPDPLPQLLEPQREIPMAAKGQGHDELPRQVAPVYAAAHQLQPRAQFGIRDEPDHLPRALRPQEISVAADMAGQVEEAARNADEQIVNPDEDNRAPRIQRRNAVREANNANAHMEIDAAGIDMNAAGERVVEQDHEAAQDPRQPQQDPGQPQQGPGQPQQDPGQPQQGPGQPQQDPVQLPDPVIPVVDLERSDDANEPMEIMADPGWVVPYEDVDVNVGNVLHEDSNNDVIPDRLIVAAPANAGKVVRRVPPRDVANRGRIGGYGFRKF